MEMEVAARSAGSRAWSKRSGWRRDVIKVFSWLPGLHNETRTLVRSCLRRQDVPSGANESCLRKRSTRSHTRAAP